MNGESRAETKSGTEYRAEIREWLLQEAEPDYRDFSAKLLPGVENLMGVRLPKIRRLARYYAQPGRGLAELVLDMFEQELVQGRTLYMEEKLFWGMLIGYMPCGNKERKRRLDAFLPAVDNWSVCDSVCITCKFMREEPEVWWQYLEELWDRQAAFAVRFAIVCGLDFFIEETYLERFLERLETTALSAYYVEMAQAWALSMCYVAFPEKTERVLAGGKLSDSVQNKTIQKIRESRQADRAQKDAVLRYRRSL